MSAFSTYHRHRRILTVGASVLSVLITLEVTTQLFRPDFATITYFDPDLGMTLQPGLSQPYFNSEGKCTVEMRSNSLGLRGQEYGTTKPDNTIRVAVFGDSFTEARAFEEEETFCGQLASLLNSARIEHPTRWEVINVGVSGCGTASQLAIYRKKIKALEPDIIIVCFSPGTDPVDNSAELTTSPYVRSRLDEQGSVELVPPASASLRKGLMHSSRFYLWQKEKINHLVNSLRPNDRTFNSKFTQLTFVPPPPPIERAWVLTEKLLVEFQSEVESQGAEFHVVCTPQAWLMQTQEFERMLGEPAPTGKVLMGYPIQKLKEICEAHQLSFLDLSEAFREAYPYQDSQHSDEWLFLKGRGHYTLRGHKLVAREIFRFLDSKTSSEARSPGIIARNPDDDSVIR